MLLNNRTILITGGSSGIGFELATQLCKKGNTVIITGRSAARLEEAKKKQPGLITIQSDVSKLDDILELFAYIKKHHPDLSVLINNAGIMRQINLHKATKDIQNICEEINTNLIALIQMSIQFLPLLREQKEAAIVNISSGLAFVPFPITPIYSASKAGVNSFTRSLRVQLQDSGVKVFEIAAPAAKTNMLDAVKDMEGGPLMEPSKVASAAIHGIERDKKLVLPGAAKILKFMSRLAPEFLLRMLSKQVPAMLAKERNV